MWRYVDEVAVTLFWLVTFQSSKVKVFGQFELILSQLATEVPDPEILTQILTSRRLPELVQRG
jgi:hypothetical protein